LISFLIIFFDFTTNILDIYSVLHFYKNNSQKNFYFYFLYEAAGVKYYMMTVNYGDKGGYVRMEGILKAV
jgi:hypothetical protein